MRFSMRNLVLAGVLATGFLTLGTTRAQAQGYGCGPRHGGYDQGYGSGYGQTYGGGYNQGYGSGYGQGYGGGGGYAAPTQQYYGNGGHDFQPHWHNTQTPGGSFNWYGTGAHDVQPHEHTHSAQGGYQGYSPSPFGGVTTSYYNSTPYTYMPW